MMILWIKKGFLKSTLSQSTTFTRMSSIPPTPPSPGLAQRRKGPRMFPKLPLSAFSPPATGTSDTFPLPPSPATAHPTTIVDANVAATPSQLAQWKEDVGQSLSSRIGAVVLSLQGKDDEIDKILKEYVHRWDPSSHPLIALILVVLLVFL